MNMADYEIALGLLKEAGHVVVESPESAEILMIFTCIVKTPTERKMLRRIRELRTLGKPLIIAGCMPEAERPLIESEAPEASLLGPDDLLSVVDVVEAALRGERRVLVGGEMRKTRLPRVRRNPVIHIAPIASGCLGECSYCIVKRARGWLRSYPAEEIVEDVRRALGEGCREIWVTAEDTAAYRWRGLRLPDLLEMLSGLDGRFYIRVGMMTPNQALEILDELIEAYRSPKIFKFLHLPVQSGSDEVLRRMRRRYTVEDFKYIVSRFREAHPESGARWIGWRGEALVDEYGRRGTLVARNYTYRPIVLKAQVKLGEFIEVEIKEARVGYLVGESLKLG